MRLNRGMVVPLARAAPPHGLGAARLNHGMVSATAWLGDGAGLAGGTATNSQ